MSLRDLNIGFQDNGFMSIMFLPFVFRFQLRRAKHLIRKARYFILES